MTLPVIGDRIFCSVEYTAVHHYVVSISQRSPVLIIEKMTLVCPLFRPTLRNGISHLTHIVIYFSITMNGIVCFDIIDPYTGVSVPFLLQAVR